MSSLGRLSRPGMMSDADPLAVDRAIRSSSGDTAAE